MTLLRYCLIGGGATAVHYLALLVLVEAALMQPAPAAAIGASVGALFAYWGNRSYTFGRAKAHRQALPRFALVALLGAAFNGGVVAAGVAIGWHYMAAQVVATAATVLATFAFNRAWTFV